MGHTTFVTGGTGFLGGHLICSLLGNGQSVVALRRPGSSISFFNHLIRFYHLENSSFLQNLRWVEGDLLDTESLLAATPENADVYHCAASVDFQKGLAFSRNINVNGTAHLVDVCLEKKTRRLCHVSSIATLEKPIMEEILTEESLWQDGLRHSAYAESKHFSEMEVNRGLAEGLDAFMVHPSVITGPCGVNSSFGQIIRAVEKGLKFYPPGMTGWVDVRDVARAMILLMEDPSTTVRYVLTAENLPHKMILEFIAKNLNVPSPHKTASPALLHITSTATGLFSKMTSKKNMLPPDLVRSMSSKNTYASLHFPGSLPFSYLDIATSIENACRFHQLYR